MKKMISINDMLAFNPYLKYSVDKLIGNSVVVKIEKPISNELEDEDD